MTWHNDQVSEKETDKIITTAKECLAVEGDFVELGCYRGDTSLLLAEVIRDYSTNLVENSVDNPVKRLWIYDSFEGLPTKSSKDASELGILFRAGELSATKREVKQRFLRAGLPVPIIKKKWFHDLTPADLPDKIAFAFLDGDFYESIRDSLRIISGKMASGSVIIIHDYDNSALPGVAKAVDEWWSDNMGQLNIYHTMAIITLNKNRQSCCIA